MKKPWNWLSFIAGLGGALVVLGGIWLAAIVIDAQQRAEYDEYLRCLAALGFTRESVDTPEELDGLGIAAELCSD